MIAPDALGPALDYATLRFVYNALRKEYLTTPSQVGPLYDVGFNRGVDVSIDVVVKLLDSASGRVGEAGQ